MASIKRPNYRETIITLAVIAGVYVFLIALLMWLEEGAPSGKINSLQDALWYVIATLTSVGYGDIIPVTYWGRMLGFIFLLSTFGVYGFIIGQIANFMSTLKEQRELGLYGTEFANHAVIIGWNDFAQSVIGHLVGAGRQVAIVTKDRPSVDIIREYYSSQNVFTLYSDYNNFDLLEKANIKRASIVFINLNDDTEKLVYIINIKRHFPNLNYVVTLDNGNLKSTFVNAGVTYAISKNEISSKLLASYIYEPDVAIFSEEIIAYAHEDHEYDMKEFLIATGNPFIGMPYEKAFFDLKKQCNVVLIGLVRVNEGKRVLYKNPEGGMAIQDSDYLVMLMDRKGQDRLKKVFHIEEGV
ncbi:MAG: NAD-binding protein [Cyclobacteriaceae bacterium]|nr:NAD-binding protein [Cyclobacteriaceae bacterium]